MIFVALGRIAQFLLLLGMMRFATSFLSPEEMGKVSLVLTTTAFFALFLVNPVGMFINRRIHAWYKSGAIQFYSIFYGGYLIIVALMSTIILVIINFTGLVDFGAKIEWLLPLVSCSLIFNTINQTSIPSLNLLGYRREFIFLSLLTVLIGFVSAAFFVTKISASSLSWLSGLLVGQILLAVVGTKILFRRLHSQKAGRNNEGIKRLQVQALFNFAWPISVAAGLWWIQSQGYRYLVERILGVSELGLFVAGFGISVGVIAGFESILTTYFQPKLYSGMHSSDSLKQILVWKTYANSIIPVLILTSLYIAITSAQLTMLFLGSDFQSASQYIVWGAIAETARVVSTTFSLMANMKMKTTALILPNLFGAINSVILCFILMPIFDINGAGLALALSGLGVVVAMYVFLIRPIVGYFFIDNIPALIFSMLILFGASKLLINLINPMGVYENLLYLVLTGVVYLVLIYYLIRRYI